MENWKFLLIGLGIGLFIAFIVYIVMVFRRSKALKAKSGEVEKYKAMLTNRMELESEGLNKLKKENEELKEKNKNLEISILALSQKPGKKELEKLEVYQAAIDRLSLQSPGFAPAWQSSLREAEEEYKKVYKGGIPFIRKFIQGKSLEIKDDQES